MQELHYTNQIYYEIRPDCGFSPIIRPKPELELSLDPISLSSPIWGQRY